MSLSGKMLIALLTVIFCSHSKAEVYKVGDSSGWTSLAPPDYKAWAVSKTFRVNDTIVFEYNKQFHNVVRVSHKNFNTCNTTAAYATWATGNDSFKIPKAGHFYFICGVPGHCQNGQRVDIRVNTTHSQAPALSPLSPETPPSSGPSPSANVAPAESPKKSGSNLLNISWKGLALAWIVFICNVIAY